MKKVILFIGLLLFCTIDTSIAYAGTLNEYEAVVVEAAKGQYEFEGIKYQVDSSYINQLIDYLSSDDVELTEEQKDTVLLSVNDYIETGVQEGYLIPVQEQDTIEDTNTQPDSTEEAGTGIPNSEESNKDASEAVEDTEEANSTGPTGTTEGTVDNFIEEILTKKPATITNVDTENGKVTIVDSKESNVLTVNTVVKNTGFNLNRTTIIVMGMGILMLIGIYVTVKNDYFAQSDE
jgi:hypothetical protein